MSYIGNTQQNQSYVPAVDFFSGNGSTTAFTLSKPVASTAQIQAVISNVPQTPGVAYTVSGSTITFTSAPPSGTNNIYVYYTSPNTTIAQPGQGTVYPSSLSTGGPSWDTAGNLTLNNGAADGAQLVLKSAGYSDWNIDNYSGRLRAYYGATEYFTVDSSGNVGIGTSSPSAKLNVIQEVRVSYQSGSPYYLTLSDADGDCRINANGTSAALLFGTTSSGGVLAERMRIDSSGNLLVGTTSLISNYGKLSINFDGGTLNGMSLQTTKSTTGSWFSVFQNSSGATAGTIAHNGTTTVAYNTSSDYRLKENIQPMQNALGVVQQLNPVTYTWKSDGSDGQGFIAHELQAVVPDCVTGEKDAVDEEGKPVYQGIDTSFLVATLTKAIQEQQAQIETLTAKVAALEAK